MLVFSYTIVEPSDRIWGAPINDKGDWNGIVGMIVRKVSFGNRIAKLCIKIEYNEYQRYLSMFIKEGCETFDKAMLSRGSSYPFD